VKYILSALIIITVLNTIVFAQSLEVDLPSSVLPDEAITRTDIPSHIINATATFTYYNESDWDAKRVVHRVTMPPGNVSGQILMAIGGDILELAFIRPHKNGIDNFISFQFPIKAHETVAHHVTFSLLTIPLDYHVLQLREQDLQLNSDETHTCHEYLRPSKHIESDADEIQKASYRIKRTARSYIDQVQAAYEFPSKHLRFKPQDSKGALAALQSGNGDCVEYACLFAALCRASGIPARTSGTFCMRNDSLSAKAPTHVAAEVYIPTLGWIPSYPNLGAGRYDRDYGLGRSGNTLVLIKREGPWVWSNWLPPDAYSDKDHKPVIKAEETRGQAFDLGVDSLATAY